MASIFADSWISQVFEGRDKEYGAYELRRRNAKITGIALLIAILFFGTAVSTPLIIEALGSDDMNAQSKKILSDLELTVKSVDPNEPPPPPPPKPPPLKDQIKFTEMEVVKDEDVQEEDEPPPQTDMQDKDAGVETIQGDPNQDLGDVVVAQEEIVDDPEPDKVFTVVEQMPEFPGGDKALMNYLASVQYPSMAKENDMEGTVHIRFVIDKNGQVTNAEVVKGNFKVLNEAALAHVRKMPAWKPGKQNGKEVKVQYAVPIKFVLQH